MHIQDFCFKYILNHKIMVIVLRWRWIIAIYICFLISLSYPKNFNPDNLPIIIWWGELFPYTTPTKEIQCTLGNCLSTKRKKFQSDIIPISYIFYGTDFVGTNLPLPRKQNHVWTLFHEESPMNNYIFSHLSGIKLFNYTATFSKESDFPLTTQHLPSLEYLLRKPIPLVIKNQYRGNGTAPVLYLQSHCNVASDRDRYVEKLMQFINIDSYGTCLHNKDLPSNISTTDTHNDEELFKFISNYKFHLAFENAICDDYITEKFYRALHVGSVPIYKGSPSINIWLPSPTSAILVEDFKDPEELANFILKVDQEDELYEKYLAFKENVTNEFLLKTMNRRKWGVNDPDRIDFIKGFECFVCDKMKTVKKSLPSIANKRHMNCPQPHPSFELDNLKSINKDKWLQEGWAETYWFAYDQAKAIELMIKNGENDTSNFWNYISMNKY